MAQKSAESEVNAFPAKRFFVEMLTRDIELKDAILDLLDNCVDGAMRGASRDGINDPPYDGYRATISFDENSFTIEDNCGGIPLELAKNAAFRMGRVNPDTDSDIPTVGVYGIGMKRAIFKLGKNATVSSKTEVESFTVSITPAWMADDDDWHIPIQEGICDFSVAGTKISVDALNDHIARILSDETDFCDQLINDISAYYGAIIDKGFDVVVNGVAVPSSSVAMLFDPQVLEKKNGIAPFLYEASHDGVDVSVVIGFYRDLPSNVEEEQALAGRPSSEKSGITVVCNDRVVVYADKTRMTGWGEASVPQYHTQFVSIAGLVTFKANDASKLPVTTTKRGLDGNSELYLGVKEVIREGIKHFTSYTNKVKKDGGRTHKLRSHASAAQPREVIDVIPDSAWSEVRKGIGGRRFVPPLPVPKSESKERWIRFKKNQADIQLLAEYFFDDADMKPSDIGEKCFDECMKKVRR